MNKIINQQVIQFWYAVKYPTTRFHLDNKNLIEAIRFVEILCNVDRFKFQK